MATYYDETGPELIEKVITVNRNSKVVKGGRRYSFSALVVVGDGNGSVGLGFGKANEVTDAISKALSIGRKSMIEVARYNTTIPFQITGKYKAGKVFLKPATTGTGIIAGGAVRAVIEAAGINDILSKNMGSNNSINVAKATLEALKGLISKKNTFAHRGIILRENEEEEQVEQPAAASTDIPAHEPIDEPESEIVADIVDETGQDEAAQTAEAPAVEPVIESSTPEPAIEQEETPAATEVEEEAKRD